MATLLAGKDRWGRSVVLGEECWERHVLPRRPYFAGQERPCVEDTLKSPSVVKHDVDYPTRECFNRPSPLPYPHGGLFVKVVVVYAPFDGVGAEVGTVVTVHLTGDPKAGEKRKWP